MRIEIDEIFRLILVRPMGAVSIYRALLLLRGCWLLLVWFFGWRAHTVRVNSFVLLHSYASLFAEGTALASWLSHTCRPLVLSALGPI